mmetsp:Transcript_45246/g.113892  ORF Transcript_45246/g.113892 Transcript_45246/m.113892 type:complete len:459 (+) Transcript_45246:92-1468(+)
MADHKARRLNVVFLGHKDSGKSSVLGRLVFDGLSEWDRTRATVDANKVGLDHLKYGIAVSYSTSFTDDVEDISLYPLQLSRSTMMLRELAPVHYLHQHYLAQIVRAHVAVLVISAAVGEFEAGFCREGQTRLSISLAHHLGATPLLVVVTKMDHQSVQYSAARFAEIRQETDSFLSRRLGVDAATVSYVPVSAWHGDNVRSQSASGDQLAWWDGPSLRDLLDGIELGPDLSDLPLRIDVIEVRSFAGIDAQITRGRVLSGTLREGMTLLYAPSMLIGTVRKLIGLCETAGPGVQAEFLVDHEPAHPSKGELCCELSAPDPVCAVRSFTARLVMVRNTHSGSDNLLKVGQVWKVCRPIASQHTACSCRLTKLSASHSLRSGLRVRAEPASAAIRAGEVCMAEFEPLTAFSVEEFAPGSETPLGGISLHPDEPNGMHTTVAVGVVCSVSREDGGLTKPAR